MSAKTEKVKSLEEILAKLILHNGCWAMETTEGLYMFPQEITREKAIEVLTRAYEYNTTKYN